MGYYDICQIPLFLAAKAKDQFTSRIPTSRYDSSTYTKANLAQRPIADI